MEAFTGEIKIVPYNFAPAGWHFCDGSLLPIAQYQSLFALIGIAFGGDGRQNFALPDLRGRFPIGVGNGVELGDERGFPQVRLTSNQIPSVNAKVAIPVNTITGTSEQGFDKVPQEDLVLSPSDDTVAGAEILLYGPLQGPNDSGTLRPFSISTDGGSAPVDVRNPSLGLNYIICLDEIFPPHS